MEKLEMTKSRKIIIISLIIIILDQIVKTIIRLNLHLLETITVIPNFFYITYTKNTGGAWSLLEGNQLFLIIISIIFLIGLVLYVKNEKNCTKLSLISYSLIIGGVIGNLLDRLFLNAVIDFLSFKIIKYYFPIFNIADITIVIGTILFMLDTIRSEVNERNKNRR